MPDNNGVSNNDVEPISSILKPIQEDAARDTKSGEGMSGQPESANKRECLELSASQDSITAEETAGMGTIILTTEPEDNGLQTKTDTVGRCSEDAREPEFGGEGPLIRVIPPTLALDIRPGAGGSAARKSPVTVQEWVDSLPPPRIQASNPSETWPLPRPTASLVREPSVQSDAGSHCSSVESLLGSRRADPEQILMGLGFGGGTTDCESDVSRIPRRFLQPSKVKGVIIDDFLKHQQDLVQNFESGYNGYRGLTGTGQRQSVIVAKIMEKLRGGSCRSASPPPSPAGKRFSKVARKVMNVLPSSVLTPDNRRFLDGQGGKSPEVPRKRMIIGQRSFTIDRDGDLIELHSATNNINISNNESSKTSTKNHVLSPSLSLSSSERANENQSSAQNLTNDRRSLSLDSSEAPPAHSTPKTNLTEVSHTTIPLDLEFSAFKPDFSVSSRSASIDSTDSPSLSHHPLQSGSELPWGIPLSQRRNRFSSTSISSWESVSPKGDYERSFPRYESIEETSERGDLSSEPSVSTSNEEIKTSLQLRRGSLKRQQHVEEDVLPNSDTIEHIVEECDVFTSSSHDTLSQPYEDSVSMNSSLMEQLLNPDKNQQNQKKIDVSDESLQVPSLEAEVETASQPVPESARHFDSDDAMQMRVVSTLMRARSDSSGFLDLEGDGPSGDERNAMAAIEQNQRELDELVQELKERGVTTGNCRDTAVKLALTSYGDELKHESDAKADIPNAHDLETLSQLRETVAGELRRVADLLDEQPSATGIPIITAQMTALLREQTKLRRQLETLNCEPSSSLDNIPSCCNMLSLVREEHRHLENLVEQNSRELAHIRHLLHELLATQR